MREHFVKLRNMKRDEFTGYSSYFIADYSEEISQNYGHNKEYSLKLAEEALLKSFPNGIEPGNTSLLSIDLNSNGENKLIGYLWHSINTNDSTSFIYDFYIFTEFRSKGYGKDAIKQLEKILLDSDIKELKLRVAYNNNKALHLYEEIGFNITGLNLSKIIK